MRYVTGQYAALARFGISEKIARVRGPVKQYRRALQMLTPDGDPHIYHGTRTPTSLQGILEDGMKPARGAHGHGVYFWRDRPVSNYLDNPNSLGVALRPHHLPASRPERPMEQNPGRDLLRRHMRIWDGVEGKPLSMSPRDTVIAPPEVLRDLRELMRARRVRPMDSAVFHRAEADVRARVIADKLKTQVNTRPSTGDVLRTPKQRHDFRPMRGVDPDDYLDAYEAATSRR